VRVVQESTAATTVMPAGPATASVRILSGDRTGLTLPVGSPTVVGRLPECELTLDDPSVSRRHARILRQGERWTIEDLGSTNGVRVNGATVGHAELRPGDRLELGAVKLEFSAE
jgi:pSer/pThr/pTyr-binding forkhead associated (FHA) protein